MKTNDASTIKTAKQTSHNLLDSLLALQAQDGYLTPEGLEALAKARRVPAAQIYDAASFYSMLRFSPPGKVRIQICRGAPCHVAGAAEVITALEKALGIQMGESTPDGQYALAYTECIGQCQASPSLLVNGRLYTDMSATKVTELLNKGGWDA